MIELRQGTKTAVLSTGAMLKYCLDFISKNNNSWGLYSFPFVKPLDSDTLIDICKQYNEIITIEEHQTTGGLSSAVLESINELKNPKKSYFSNY